MGEKIRMIRNVKRAWFEVWGDEQAQNVFLKGLALFLGALILVESVALVVLSTRHPVLISLTPAKTAELGLDAPPKELLDAELRRIAGKYVQTHYSWEWKDAEAALARASAYVHPDFRRKFLAANEAQLKVAREKKISQRFHVLNLSIDEKPARAVIEGERVLVVEGLRVVTPFKIELSFELGARSALNPEGFYVKSEVVTTQN